ncbi:MAG: YceI family protein [Dehalococcoidia bacterium]
MNTKLFITSLILLSMLISCSSNVNGKTIDPASSESEIALIEKVDNSNKSGSSKINDSNMEPFLKVEFLPSSTARYLITEQLANLDFPIDAIGETNQISGLISFNESGKIIQNNSTIVVNVNSLKSDSGRRDRYISRKSLESDKYPEATINIKKINNMPWPLPESGSVEVEIIGDMNVHGVTDEVTWKTDVNFEKDKLNGISRTNFKFEKFNMDLPRVAIVLSVENNIRLVLEFSAEIVK